MQKIYMRAIALHGKHGEGKFVLVSDCDYEELNKYHWVVRAYRTGLNPYAIRWCGRLNHIYMHRQVLGDKKGFVIDHINHDTLNNTRENLRYLTNYENLTHRSVEGQKRFDNKYYKKNHLLEEHSS
jgi:hypothetical protein